jgi:hypothetical protein
VTEEERIRGAVEAGKRKAELSLLRMGATPQPALVSAEVSTAPTPSKQLRIRGGFIDESKDEEAEPIEPFKSAIAQGKKRAAVSGVTNLQPQKKGKE